MADAHAGLAAWLSLTRRRRYRECAPPDLQPMVRSRDYLDGFPWLLGYRLRRAEERNSTRDTALGVCRVADEGGAPGLFMHRSRA